MTVADSGHKRLRMTVEFIELKEKKVTNERKKSYE